MSKNMRNSNKQTLSVHGNPRWVTRRTRKFCRIVDDALRLDKNISLGQCRHLCFHEKKQRENCAPSLKTTHVPVIEKGQHTLEEGAAWEGHDIHFDKTAPCEHQNRL